MIAETIHYKYTSTPTHVQCRSNPSDPESFDEVLYNTRILLRDLFYFRTIHAAVKSGDFGHIEEMLGLFAIYWSGAGARNYCTETLHLILNLNAFWPKKFAYVSVPLSVI